MQNGKYESGEIRLVADLPHPRQPLIHGSRPRPSSGSESILNAYMLQQQWGKNAEIPQMVKLDYSIEVESIIIIIRRVSYVRLLDPKTYLYISLPLVFVEISTLTSLSIHLIITQTHFLSLQHAF